MIPGDVTGLFIGAIALGAVHGVEPGHGWPVAASYALDQTNKWFSGFAAGLVLGLGHLVSSIAMVGLFFYAKSYFSLTQVNEPLTLGGVQVGGPVSVVAGLLLIVLGVREYRGGHSHGGHEHEGHEHEGHEHSHTEHNHRHEQGQAHSDTDDEGLFARVKRLVPFVGGHSHATGHARVDTDRGLFGIAWFAFLLGFAHEEEFEIIALCAGSTYCLELMSAYAVTVVVGIVGLTMLLVAGYQHSEDRVERYIPYLPLVSATVLVVMGVGFVLGLF